MKLQQLRYIVEIAKRGLNISNAADNLFTSQPGISKQVKLLEDELGIQIFIRSGKHLTGITPPGQKIVALAEEALRTSNTIAQIAAEYADENKGSLTIATTHTQARHALPPTVKQFRQRYPDVSLHLHQGTPQQVAEMAANGTVDFAIATEAIEHFEELVMLPCYRWNRCLVVPPTHPLLKKREISLQDIVAYPLITYVFGFTGRSKLDQAFAARQLTPNVVLTATDSEVIKTYVKLELGVGIIARMAFDAERDDGLAAIDVSHLFEPSTTNIGFLRGTYLRRYTYDFMALFAPHLKQPLIDAAANAKSADEKAFAINQFKMGQEVR